MPRRVPAGRLSSVDEDAARLLEPARWDELPIAGCGFSAQVRRAGGLAIKIAHPDPGCRARLAQEIDILAGLQDGRDAIGVPRLRAVRPDRHAFVRDYLALPCIYALLQEGRGRLAPQVFAALLDTHAAVEALRQRAGLTLDFTPVNLYYDARRRRVLLADLGVRVAPNPFAGLSPEEMRRALARYVRWRARLDGPTRLRRLILPPSGRFAVEVPVGPVASARLLWKNEGLLRRLGLPWNDAKITELGSLATFAPDKNIAAVATRYLDSPDPNDAGVKGDGRAVYIGCLEGGSAGPRELMLKGCGPTPLAWLGKQYHEDGFVSFPRTLWETSVADELARLGFETPENMAILSNGERTLDNTERHWPAATAIRVARSHYRLGHLARWTGDPDALRAICQHIGATLLGLDFDATSPRSLAALALGFAANLGFDTGRTDALNIHCFNPTMGNVRLDGHFLDFSTVRFFRYYVPHFRFLNDKRQVRLHASLWRTQLNILYDALRRSGLLAAAEAMRLLRRMQYCFDGRYLEGYLAGLGRFLGVALPRDLVQRRRAACRRLVAQTRELRALRADEVIDFRFWKQVCPAPLFDLEGRAPDFLRALARNNDEPWQQLRSRFKGSVGLSQEKVARAWLEALLALFSRRQLRAATPRRWDEIIRPRMEAESLASLCYRRSRPTSFAEWRCFASTSRHLPEGRYDYLEARALAKGLGHVALPGLLPHRYEYVVGLTPELYAAICEILTAKLKGRLVGVIAHGSRVMTCARVAEIDPQLVARNPALRRKREGIREFGPDPGKSSDLDLKVFIRKGLAQAARAALERELGAALAALGACFPLSAHRPPRQRLVETAADNLEAAFARYNDHDRQRLQGKPPIPEEQVVLFSRRGQTLPDPVDAVMQLLATPEPSATCRRLAVRQLVLPRTAELDTGCPLSLHQLEMCMRDEPEVQPATIVARPFGSRYRTLAGAGAVVAARRAGRRALVVSLEKRF
jgi:hypothetical protein